jgi:hypothetical protein
MSHATLRLWKGARLVLHALSPLVILVILGAPTPSLPAPWQRVLLALVVAAFNVLLAAPSARGRVAGLLFFWAILSSTLRYGQVWLGLQAEWQRWVVGLLLSAPFVLLLAASTPGGLKTRLDAWRERRSRR